MALAAALAALLHVTPARAAATLLDDDWAFHAVADLDDAEAHELWSDGASQGSLWVSLQVSFVRRDEGKNDLGAMVLVGVPIERIAEPAGTRRARGRIAKATNADPLAPSPEPAPSTAAETTPELPPAPPRILISPSVARAVVSAAIEHARLEEHVTRIDRVASRARASALLPELRLRVTRLLDESRALSPTEYDPDRVTAAGGSSLWLEARATFRFDRLVFADEEVALERLREERAAARHKLEARVLEALFTWQRACVERDDETREPEARTRAVLTVMEADGTLDVLTGGFWSRWKTTRLGEDATATR
ncbi:hypothetical protein [Polyangium jinanense]|uniref:Uncharacterized protein n=1 Tax=Polyangium jinanense TaxID=2829994 RepID=A0A9X3X028_9BACT|nr:hypothetical protein [Polyangium jinanense]MDC3955018.1 hypothetical protein [Polyangium jinanense]MDC3981212.1 hypothetical protein [Polyangium jinanense]